MAVDPTTLRLVYAVERLDRHIAIMAEQVGPLGEWITTEQAKRHFGIGRTRLYQLQRMDIIRGSLAGGGKRWRRRDLERYVYGDVR